MAAETTPGFVASTYVEQEILSEGPLARIARLYRMTSIEVRRARAALSAGDAASKGRAVRQACACISVLQSSLNLGAGGDVARNLDRVYGYLLRRLSEAHVHNDDGAFAEILTHLESLGEAWRDIADRGDVTSPRAASRENGVAAGR